MFVLTLSKKRYSKILTGAAVFLMALLVGIGRRSFLFKDSETSRPVSSKLTTTREMADYIFSKGYTVDLRSRGVKEVKIPKKFDREFENFNSKIMATDGLSLEKYKNDKVNKWTFTITDYDVESKTATAVLLIKKDKLIGAYLLQQPEGTAYALAKNRAQGDILQ